jgi:dTMP kinase
MPITHPRGLFITFEGGDACGKSTQAKRAAIELNALWTREPGGTDLGVAIRELCLGDRFDPSPETEVFLMAADRTEHVQRLMLPAILAGRNVVGDRYTQSTIAYQGAGHGLDADFINEVTARATCGLIPDLVLVIHVTADVANARQIDRGTPDRMERAGNDFQARVRQSYLDQAETTPNMVVIDGSGTQDEVAVLVHAAISERFPTAFA